MAKKGLGRGFSSLIPTEMIIDEKIDSDDEPTRAIRKKN